MKYKIIDNLNKNMLILMALCSILFVSTGATPAPERIDKKVGTEIKKPKYQILYRRNVERISVYDRGSILNEISFTFNKGFTPNKIFDVHLTGDSGTQIIDYNFVGFKNVEYPFRGKIRYTTLDKYQTYLIQCEVEIVITEPGYWEINLMK